MRLQQAPLTSRLAVSASEDAVVEVLRFAALPALVTTFVALTGTGTATLTQTVISFAVLQIAWGSWLTWKRKSAAQKDFPLFACLAGMYWLAYALPAFWSKPDSWHFSSGYVSSDAITRAQLLALLGLVSVYFGMRLRIGHHLRRVPTLDMRNSFWPPKYVALAMLAGIAMRYFPAAAYVLGAELRQVFMILFNTVPVVGYAILLRRSLTRPVPLYERGMLVVCVLGTLFAGLSSGWLGVGAAMIMVTGCVYIDTRRAIPKAAVVIVFAYIFFLQPAKEEFRARYWHTDNRSDEISRAGEWLSLSRDNWESAFAQSNSEALRQPLYTAMSRFALLQQTANVMDLTPAIIPHQGWGMYSYMLYTYIPRALWKDKPSVNQANRFYQVTYGMTTERNLDGVSISVGVLAESYISFGWLGAALVMTLIGVVLDCLSSLLLSVNAGTVMKALGMALLPGLVAVESQMAQYLGGLVQQLGLTLIVMLPIVVIRRRDVAPMFRRNLRPPARMFAAPKFRPAGPLPSRPVGQPVP